MPVSSPCVGICVVSTDRVCIGCQRTLDEIASWSTASDAWKREVLERTHQRPPVTEDDRQPAPPAARANDGQSD